MQWSHVGVPVAPKRVRVGAVLEEPAYGLGVAALRRQVEDAVLLVLLFDVARRFVFVADRERAEHVDGAVGNQCLDHLAADLRRSGVHGHWGTEPPLP
jgi:hypothetical protein